MQSAITTAIEITGRKQKTTKGKTDGGVGQEVDCMLFITCSSSDMKSDGMVGRPRYNCTETFPTVFAYVQISRHTDYDNNTCAVAGG